MAKKKKKRKAPKRTAKRKAPKRTAKRKAPKRKTAKRKAPKRKTAKRSPKRKAEAARSAGVKALMKANLLGDLLAREASFAAHPTPAGKTRIAGIKAEIRDL